jgi:G3E family GTPase
LSEVHGSITSVDRRADEMLQIRYDNSSVPTESAACPRHGRERRPRHCCSRKTLTTRLPNTKIQPGASHPIGSTVSWTSDRLVSIARLQAAIAKLAPNLARAKGLFEAAEQPGRQFVFQFAGGRATLAPAGTPSPGLPRARIVFVAEIGALSSTEVSRTMDKCVHPAPG